MKHIFNILLLLGLAFPAMGQKNMNIEVLFDGPYQKHKDAVEIHIKGDQLKEYKLSLYRSLMINSDTAVASHIEPLVRADAVDAVGKEERLVAGRLLSGFYCLPPKKGKYRYLIYSNSALKPGSRIVDRVAVIYIEGQASMQEVKNMFK